MISQKLLKNVFKDCGKVKFKSVNELNITPLKYIYMYIES